MNQEELKAIAQELKPRYADYLAAVTEKSPKAKDGEEIYICPKCGDSSHQGAAGGIKLNPQSTVYGLHCFACNFSGDIIQLEMERTGATFSDAVRQVAEIINFPLPAEVSGAERSVKSRDGVLTPAKASFTKNPTTTSQKPKTTPQTPPETEIEAFRDYFAYGRETLPPEAVAELATRGISPESAYAYQCTYCSGKDDASAPEIIKRAAVYPSLIFPTLNPTGALCRRFTAYQNADKKGKAPFLTNADGWRAADITLPWGGWDSLGSDAVLFVVEGIYDALAVTEMCGFACSLNGVGGKTKFSQYVKSRADARQTLPRLVLSLDNDKTGQKAQEDIKQALDGLRIPYITANIAGTKYKDANERLMKDPDGLRKAIDKAVKRAENMPEFANERKHGFASYFNDDYLTDLARQGEPIKTGFNLLDAKLGGGLRAGGLYILGAPPAEGKTTYALQMAAQMAEAGYKCVFFSLEMAQVELTARLISSILYKANKHSQLSEADILDRGRKVLFDEPQTIAAGIEKIGDNLQVYESAFNFGPDKMQRIIQDSEADVVFIDYLQIMAMNAAGNDARARVDETLTKIKRVARAEAVPVVAISNMSRAGQSSNQKGETEFSAFKESSQIEYTADAVLALERLNDEGRGVRLRCLKNRKGGKFKLLYEYHRRQNTFTSEQIYE
jgi:KaiC/GvpD/RAD55 family RecA-like ATPase